MPEAAPLHIAFLLFPDVTQLDLTGPAQVLSRLGNVKLDLVARTRDPVPTDAQFPLLPTATFEEVQRTDILCVPGGFGTIPAMEDVATLAWVRQMAGTATWITSVCTGSLVLAAAGLLTGYRAGGGVTAGIDFALALTARIRGEDYAKFVQLSLEYDPAPPFDSGAPERADAATLARYRSMVEKFAPGRAEKVRSIAARRAEGGPRG